MFYSYVIEHNEKYYYYLFKCQFKLFLKDNQHSSYVTSNLFDTKTMISWSNSLEKVIIGMKYRGYKFNYIEEMKIITMARKTHMPYDYYIKHNLHAVEWKLNDVIIRKKFDQYIPSRVETSFE